MSRTNENPHPAELLSAYLDGELATHRREAVEAHLRECAECAAALDELRAVMARARCLPDRPPERDLWPEIERRLASPAPERVTSGQAPRRWPWARRFSLSVPQLAAAALALVVLSGGAVWLALRAALPRADAGSAAIVSSVPLAPAPESVAAGGLAAAGAGAGEPLGGFEAARYDAAVADLERVLERNRGRLDPATIRTVEANLAVIDRAIAQARSALLADPSSPYLNGHLAEQMTRKLQVLRRAADAVAANDVAQDS